MTIYSKIFALFPLIQFALIGSSLVCFSSHGSWPTLFGVLFFIYLFPLICFRVLVFLCPIKEGDSDIMNDQFSPWWAGHQIQSLFIALPWLESCLRIIPGLFSIWLRAWGSQIGKNVYWTPGVTIYDRNLLDIGDHVIFGERALTVSHVITPKDGKGLLKISKVIVKNGAFVGAGSVLSPGVIVEEGVLIKAGTNLYPNQRATKEGII